MDYKTALRTVHDTLAPRSYVEIGCRHGASLELAACTSIGIDPDFEIHRPLLSPTRLFKQTSDDFFRDHDLGHLLGGAFDLAFIDGMHRAEFVLRDFINLERHAHRGSVILVDDVLPEDMSWTTRERNTQAWTGDVYKLIPLLMRERPDLNIAVFDIRMKGLAIITGLNPQNTVLQDSYTSHESYLCGPDSALGSIEDIRAALAPRDPGTIAQHLQDHVPLQVPATPTGPKDYLELLKKSLLNEIYLDDELRLNYLRNCMSGDDTFDYDVYHDIRKARAHDYDELKRSREIGQFLDRDIHRAGFSHTMMGRKRLDNLHHCLDSVIKDDIAGDLIECGVWRGGGCIFMAGYLEAHVVTGRRILVADSFEGLPVPSHEADLHLDLSKEKFPELAVSLETVKQNFAAYGLLNSSIVFLKGWFKETLPTAPTTQIALLRLDGDLYESTMDILSTLYDRVSPGGIVIVDDYALAVCRKAVADFFHSRGQEVPEMHPIDWTGHFFTKPSAEALESA